MRKINEIARNPHGKHGNLKRLKGSNFFRLRIGEYRAVLDIQDEVITLLVIEVKPRGSIYK